MTLLGCLNGQRVLVGGGTTMGLMMIRIEDRITQASLQHCQRILWRRFWNRWSLMQSVLSRKAKSVCGGNKKTSKSQWNRSVLCWRRIKRRLGRQRQTHSLSWNRNRWKAEWNGSLIFKMSLEGRRQKRCSTISSPVSSSTKPSSVRRGLFQPKLFTTQRWSTLQALLHTM